MTSPALRHRQAKLAQQAQARPETGPVATEYELLRAQLGLDLQALKGIQSQDRKVEAKRGMIDAYLPWVKAVTAAETDSGQPATQDDIVGTMLVWALDLHDWELAYQLADYVLRHGLALPRMQRQPAVVVAEEVADAAIADPAAIKSYGVALFDALTEGHDMPDQVRAKLAKAQALTLLHSLDTLEPGAESAVAGGKVAILDAAITQFERALRLDKNSGVKKLLEGTVRRRAKQAEADNQDPA